MKYMLANIHYMYRKSHPARGAWIEILCIAHAYTYASSRTPQGVRGLKFAKSRALHRLVGSHPARGAWIEMTCFFR